MDDKDGVSEARPRLRSIVVATVVAASSLAAWGQAAPAWADSAAQGYWPRVWTARFTDKSGDAFLGGTNADLRDVGAVYRGDKVTLEASTYGGTDPRTHDMWRDGSLALAWFLDTNGDGTDDWEVDYGNDGERLVADVVNLATEEVACHGDPDYYDFNEAVRLDAACIGSPASFGLSGALAYDWHGGGVDIDLAPDDGTAGLQVTRVAPRSGYWMLTDRGDVFGFGDAVALPLYTPRFPDPPPPRSQYCFGTVGLAVDIEPTTLYDGYWIVDSWGNVRTCGGAYGLSGGPPKLEPGETVVSLSAVPDYSDLSQKPFWLFTNRGRVIPVNGAPTFGDMSGRPLNGAVLDSVATPTGKGYYMVASDGGVFTFGDATFSGSMGATPLNAPVQSLVPDPGGSGYWLVASDGGIFAFGGAPFRGSLGGRKLNKPVSGMVPFGNGYLMVGEDGGIFNFSDKQFYGSLGANPPARPVIAVAALDEGSLYRLH
jgi:hypothetical protein